MALRVLWALLILTTIPCVSSAADERWQVGTAPSFSTGKYGTDERTEIVYTPIIARRLFDSGDLTLVFPFLCITGTGNVTVVNGSPVRTEQTNGRTTGAPTDRSRTIERTTRAGTAPATATATPARETTNCGLGDVVVRGRYFLIDERGWIPTIAIRAHLKTPTASAAHGLGTGRPDEGIGVEVSRTVGRGLVAMVDGGYTNIGKPAGADFRNSWSYDVGIGQDLANGVVNLSVFFEAYSSIVRGFTSSRDILAAVALRSASGWRFQVAAEVGLSDGAPDRGITFGASRRF
ncbi:MAG TPA: transporter [Vicinamibacterales bacterium]|nr:transporter [Vicinamibacterales bacterium]